MTDRKPGERRSLARRAFHGVRRRGRSREVAIAGLLVVGLAAWDWSRMPSRQWTVRAELAAIARYQAWVAPLLLRGGVRCRFTPTCSRYAAAVLAREGAVAGNLRVAGRVLRCGPWTKAGTSDPP